MARLKTKRLEVLPPLKMLELPLGRTLGFCVKIDLVREKVAQMRPKLEKFFSSFFNFLRLKSGNLCCQKLPKKLICCKLAFLSQMISTLGHIFSSDW